MSSSESLDAKRLEEEIVEYEVRRSAAEVEASLWARRKAEAQARLEAVRDGEAPGL